MFQVVRRELESTADEFEAAVLFPLGADGSHGYSVHDPVVLSNVSPSDFESLISVIYPNE